MKKTSIFLAVLALSSSAIAQTSTYKFKKPVTQLSVQVPPSSGGSNPPPVSVGELDVSTNSLNFGSVEVGNTGSLSFLVGNFGQASLSLNPVSYVGAAYTVNSLCGSSLGVSQECQVSVNFTPTARGSFNGSATVTSSQGSETVSFSGQGVQASGSLQAVTSTDFGSVVVGQTSDRTFLFSNTGDAPSRNTQLQTITAPLTVVSNSCGNSSSPVTLNPGQNCTVTLRYQPLNTTALNSNLTIASSADNSPLSLSLSGQGIQAQGSLTSLSGTNFGFVSTGQTATLDFVFNNTGTAVASGVYASVTGSSFVTLVNNNCGTVASPVNINPGQECTVSARYQPTSSGSLSGVTLAVASPSLTSPSTVSLTGSSTAPAIGIVEAAGLRQYSDGSVATSCNAYIRPPSSSGKAYTGDIGSGMYRIDPDGPTAGGISPFNVYCDMTTVSATDGLVGGWTLVLAAGNSTSKFTSKNAIGSTPILSQVPGASLNKLSDNVIFALNASLGRMQATFNGVLTDMYWRYPSQANNNPWITNFDYFNGGAPIPQCWSPQNTWVNGRYFHFGDCYNSTVLGNAAVVLRATSTGSTYGHNSSTVTSGYVWVR